MAKEATLKRKEEKDDHCPVPSTYSVDGAQATTYKAGGIMNSHDFNKLRLTPEEKLLSDEPATPVERAKWLLSAACYDFVAFNPNYPAKQNLEAIRDEKKVEELDPQAKDYDVPILAVQVGLVKKNIQQWLDAKGAKDKVNIVFGSMIRDESGHGIGSAVDINNLTMVNSVEATLQILSNLDKAICNAYKLGFPFQGQFFDPEDEIEAKQKKAEKEAGEDKEGEPDMTMMVSESNSY